MTSLFPDLPDCNLDMVLDLLCSVATAGGGGVGIPSDVAVVSSSGMVGHEVKVLLPASDNGVIEAPEGMKYQSISQHTVPSLSLYQDLSHKPLLKMLRIHLVLQGILRSSTLFKVIKVNCESMSHNPTIAE